MTAAAEQTAETGHTPAPWAYDPASGKIYYADGDVEPVVATVNWDNDSQEQADADGYVLAAAPEMFAALEACLPLFDMVTALDDHGSNALGQAENLILSALAAARNAAA